MSNSSVLFKTKLALALLCALVWMCALASVPSYAQSGAVAGAAVEESQLSAPPKDSSISARAAIGISAACLGTMVALAALSRPQRSQESR